MLDRVQGLADTAKKAYDNYDYESAYQLYGVALDILCQEASSPSVDSMMVQIYKGLIETLGKGDKWLTAIDYADRLIDESGDRQLEMEANLLAGGILLAHDSWAEGRERYEAALDLAERAGNRLAMAECYYGLAYIDCRTGNVRAAGVKTNKVLEILEGAEPSLLHCKALIECGSIDETAGNSAQAIDSFRLAIEKLKTFPPNEELARAYNNMGEAYKNMEDYTSAALEYVSCVEAARQVKSRRAELYGLANLAEC